VKNESSERPGRLQADLDAERRARQALVDASVRLNSVLSLPELLTDTLETATRLLDAETSSLLLLDEATNELSFVTVAGEPGQGVQEFRVPADRGIGGWVLQKGEAVIVEDAAADPRFYPELDRATGFRTRSLLAVPLKSRDRTIGVVEVINKRNGEAFDARDQDLATALASLAAVALENARLYRKLADAVVESRMSYRL